ncbi:apoptosis-stimulating of p53 protein 1-like isoform X3 [Tachypleus tridentatus]|uniref:apoptosis-stimulating of p53 protein 1-like isoform X3 n=1 Tax=Tachypleus tridentatus TaxID=6853 RepID=UPI003FD43A99
MALRNKTLRCGMLILKVHLDDNQVTEVPIVPESTVRDVLDCCREPGEENCTLVVIRKNLERPLKEKERPWDILQRHKSNKAEKEMVFQVRYSPVYTTDTSRVLENHQRLKNRKEFLKNCSTAKLPEGSELTLAELREMAARQQQQIEAQQQLLVAKEQRLKFLKQQEVRHHHGAQTTEGDRLRYLRERVEGQEQKLRRLRALRNQVDQQRVNNGNLGAELESIRALFNEKEKELTLAVAKVEDLTRQLEELKRGNHNGLRTSNSNISQPAAMELEKLKKELVYRTKLNEQQNARIAHQREILSKRQEEISEMDQRIADLQQRLHRKRMLNQQISSQVRAATVAKQTHVRSGATKTHPRPLNTNVVVVEPLKHASVEPDRVQDDLDAPLGGVKGVQELSEFASNKNDPKYQTLPYNTKFTKYGKDYSSSDEGEEGSKLTEEIGTTVSSSNTQQVATSPQKQPIRHPIIPPPQQHIDHLVPRVYGSTPSTLSAPRGQVSGNNNAINQGQSHKSNSLSVSTNSKPPPTLPKPKSNTSIPGNQGSSLSGSCSISKTDVILSIQSQPRAEVQSLDSPRNSGSSDGRQTQETNVIYTSSSTSLSISSFEKSPPPNPPLPIKPMPPPRQTHHLAESVSSTERCHTETSLDAVDSALSVLKGSENHDNKSTSGFRYLGRPQIVQRHTHRFRQASLDQYAKAMNHVYRNEHPTRSSQFESCSVKSTNFNSSDPSNDNLCGNTEQEHRREKLPIRPKPLTVKIPPSSDQPRLKGQQNGGTQRQGTEGINEKISSSVASQNSQNVHISINRRIEMPPAFLFPENVPPPADLSGSIRTDDRAKNQSGNDITDRVMTEAEDTIFDHNNKKQENTKSPLNLNDRLDQFNGNTTLVFENNTRSDGDGDSVNIENDQIHVSDQPLETNTDVSISEVNGYEQLRMHNSAALRRVKKGNLKTKNSTKNSRRVSFDPLALLLDAALEGELELVKKTTKEVPNPSAANDEGITALHNAICAGHFEIVKFLVEFGCDVNTQDSDGWTPLHCAASCNNQPMVRFLVEHGACVFATTLSDHDTAAQKCEEDEEGYDGCSEYLYSVQEKLGILNGGAVYAVYDYEAQNQDELSFKDGDMLIVLRKGDEQEREWWWARLKDREGYIPRNLLGLYPRVTAKRDSQ